MPVLTVFAGPNGSGKSSLIRQVEFEGRGQTTGTPFSLRTAAGELIGAPQLLAWANQERLTFMLDRVCREVHLENAGRVGCG